MFVCEYNIINFILICGGKVSQETLIYSLKKPISYEECEFYLQQSEGSSNSKGALANNLNSPDAVPFPPEKKTESNFENHNANDISTFGNYHLYTYIYVY